MKKALPFLSTVLLFGICIILGATAGKDWMYAAAVLLTWPNAFFCLWCWND